MNLTMDCLVFGRLSIRIRVGTNWKLHAKGTFKINIVYISLLLLHTHCRYTFLWQRFESRSCEVTHVLRDLEQYVGWTIYRNFESFERYCQIQRFSLTRAMRLEANLGPPLNVQLFHIKLNGNGVRLTYICMAQNN